MVWVLGFVFRFWDGSWEIISFSKLIMDENKVIVTLTVRDPEDGQELSRDIVIIDGQIPDETDQFIQKMVTLLLDKEVSF